jgi:hypothetical protein
VPVYELEGAPPRKYPACNDDHRKKARYIAERAARLKPYECKFCGVRGESARPREYCCEAHRKRARRREARAAPALIAGLKRVQAAPRTQCACGEVMVDPAPRCGFCEAEERERVALAQRGARPEELLAAA